MKKNNRKGFTIVELVIVIAVIAILAAVMIPTFTNVVSEANKKAALQEARNLYTEAYTADLADGKIDTVYTAENPFTHSKNGYTVTFNGSTWNTSANNGG